jgi:hypothetical protein
VQDNIKAVQKKIMSRIFFDYLSILIMGLSMPSTESALLLCTQLFLNLLAPLLSVTNIYVLENFNAYLASVRQYRVDLNEVKKVDLEICALNDQLSSLSEQAWNSVEDRQKRKSDRDDLNAKLIQSLQKREQLYENEDSFLKDDLCSPGGYLCMFLGYFCRCAAALWRSSASP